MKKIMMLCIIAILLLLCSIATAATYRTLKVGNNGDDVKKLKQRLYTLGYYKSNDLDEKFTADTLKRIKQFESDCGLEETEEVSPALQELIFSDNAYSKKNGDTLNGQAVELAETDANGYRDFYAGCYGDDVLAAKQMLFDWKFFTDKATSVKLNDYTLDVFKQFQKYLGVDVTGYLTSEDLESLFTLPNPAAIPQGPTTVVELPEMNSEHFLADPDAEPFVYADRDDGLWYYISQDLHIEIRNYKTLEPLMTYLECEIYCTPDNLPTSMLAKGKKADGYNLVGPQEIMKQYDAIFAISDDVFGYRAEYGSKNGIVIRDGVILNSKTLSATTKSWPRLDVLAIYPDGTMKTYINDEHTADEYIAMGVKDTYAFGPILIRDGEINPSLYTEKGAYFTEKHPRMAIGMVEPCHYQILLVRGRITTSKGCTPAWLAEHMLDMGSVEAFNLDGGRSIFMWFQGDLINRVENVTDSECRDISSMMGFLQKD